MSQKTATRTSSRGRRTAIGQPYIRPSLRPPEPVKKRDFSFIRRFLVRAGFAVLWLAGLAALLLLAAALGSYSPADPGFSVSMNGAEVRNWLGRPGPQPRGPELAGKARSLARRRPHLRVRSLLLVAGRRGCLRTFLAHLPDPARLGRVPPGGRPLLAALACRFRRPDARVLVS